MHHPIFCDRRRCGLLGLALPALALLASCGAGSRPAVEPQRDGGGRPSDARGQLRRDGLVVLGADSAAYWQPERPIPADARPDARRLPDARLNPDAGLGPSASPSCSATSPVGATRAPSARPYSRGSCPVWRAGRNLLPSGPTPRDQPRAFLLVVPSTPARPGERFPLVFAWHWLGGSAAEMVERARLQLTADQRRIVFVVPEAKGDLTIFGTDVGLFGFADVPWPFMATAENRRVEEELVFFDDLLACATAQVPINADCVSTIGLSAGALFSAQLASARSGYLASFVSLSGGVQSSRPLSNLLLRPWFSTAHRLPALVLWGGDDDACLSIDFARASRALENQLAADGHFLVECLHDCRHGLWFDDQRSPAPGEPLPLASLVDFMLAHPYWLSSGASPYRSTGLPSGFLPWCSLGAGRATQRNDLCPPSKCNLL
ncbi:MAG: hypothetical protein IPG96_07795 [Proteobacteria bacterium]|nr:hypothetical protein [Pseudomonadota bacterium]